MKVTNRKGASSRGMLRRLLRDRRGVVAVYTAILAPVLIGFAALSVDISRYMTLNTELQSAADAAALAGAAELDGRADAIERAKLAVWGATSSGGAITKDPLTLNAHRTGTDSPAHACRSGGVAAGPELRRGFS